MEVNEPLSAPTTADSAWSQELEWRAQLAEAFQILDSEISVLDIAARLFFNDHRPLVFDKENPFDSRRLLRRMEAFFTLALDRLTEERKAVSAILKSAPTAPEPSRRP